MSIIQLKEANCKNCYKCIRNCDVKSISFQNDQAQIIDDDCVLCGKCTLSVRKMRSRFRVMCRRYRA